MAKIVVIGSLNMDLVAVAPRLPVAGETLIGARFLNAPGGKGANQAYAVAKLGGAVSMLGRVGADAYGAHLRANLAEVGCDVGGIGETDAATGVAVIIVTESGQNSIVVIPGANYGYLPSDLHTDRRLLADAGLALLQLELPLETVTAAIDLARGCGARIILDPAPAPPLPLGSELLRRVDILTPNEAEANQLVGHAPRELSPDDARAIANRLKAAGANTVIVKLGARGCLLAEGPEAIWVPAPSVNARDTTAAGDVFNAALAVACAEGAPLHEACRFAVRAASISVTRLGAQASIPSRAEVDDFLP